MRAHEILTELFTQPYQWTVTQDRGVLYRVEFEAGDRTIRVDFEREGSENDWSSAFEERTSFSPGSTGITGSGDEFKVFTTVIAIHKEFIATHQVDSLTFSASTADRNRARLYERMAKRIAGTAWDIAIWRSAKWVYFKLTPKQA